jgi:hypothetical protein
MDMISPAEFSVALPEVKKVKEMTNGLGYKTFYS